MRFYFCAAAFFAVVFGFASPCTAQNFVSYVSGANGNDGASCSRSAPCRTFEIAMTHTIAGGEVDCLDAGVFGNPYFGQSISIICDGVTGAAFGDGPGTTTVTVNLPNTTDKVVLSGLNINGTGLNGPVSDTGVLINGLGTVTIRNTQIRNFGTAGVSLQGSGSNPATRVVIQNSYITNSGIGVQVTGTGGARVFIRDSFIENGTGGVSLNGSGGGNSVAISNTVIDNNSSYALSVGPSGNSVGLISSILSGSPAGIVNGGGSVNSIGPSNVFTGTGAPTASTPYR